jgi:hypothetical protein
MALFGGMKAARTGDQIDAQVQGARQLVANAKMTAQQFDFIETQLQQLAQLVGDTDQMAVMQFQNMKQQMNNIQAQIINSLSGVDEALAHIDKLTDNIQG